jgi:hypothetical protein
MVLNEFRQNVPVQWLVVKPLKTADAAGDLLGSAVLAEDSVCQLRIRTRERQSLRWYSLLLLTASRDSSEFGHILSSHNIRLPFSAASWDDNGDLFSTPLSQIQTGVQVKSPHLWLSTALIACGLFSDARARDLTPDFRFATLNSFDISSAARRLTRTTWFRPVISAKTVFRAQSDDGIPVPPDATETPKTVDLPAGTSAGPNSDSVLWLPEPTTWNAFSPPMTSDPFLNGGVAQPYAPMAPAFGGPVVGPAGAGGFQTFGANGGQPYRFGVEQRLDIFLIPAADVSGGGAAGKYEELGVNYDLVVTKPFMPGWILKETGQFRSRTWDGPAGGAGLPGSAFRLGADFELATPQTGPYSISLAITPSVNTDFNKSASSTAFQLDGRGIVWWNLSPGWMFGAGAMFWDRVDDQVLPYAGWVYRDDFWEWRLMFPESEIRLFLGNERRWAKWVYLRAKYNVDAYEITTAAGVRDEVEFEDWQLTAGFQMDAGYYRWFIEGGLILDREINFRSNPDVSVDTSYITRMGWRY